MSAADGPGESGAPADVGERTRAVERLLAFSDGVVAIAITLLVLPLIELVPSINPARISPAVLLAANSSVIAGFLISFAVTWRIWGVHHKVFARTRDLDGAISRANMAWLTSIVFLPFVVAMIGVYGADPFVVALYVGVLLVSCLALTVIAVLLRRTRPGLVAPEPLVIEKLAGNALALIAAFVVVLLVPAAGFWPLLLMLADTPVLAATHALRRRCASGRGSASAPITDRKNRA